MKKKLLGILLVCLVLVLVAAGVFWAVSSEEPEIPAVEEPPVKLYWNVDRDKFVGDSSAGMNSREKDADGFYSIRFVVDGQQVTYKVEKARLVEKIDSMEIMGLEIDEMGMVTEVYDPKEITAGEVATNCYVLICGDTTITVSSDEALEKDYQTFEINEHTGIYNVTGQEPVGFTDVAITSDRIRAFKNEDGVLTHIFILERFGYWPGKTEMKYCEHCKAEVEWRVWEEKYALPTDSAHWILENKVRISAQHVVGENRNLIVDLNGQTVVGPDGKRVYALTGENAYLAILDSSEEKTGQIVASGSPDNGSVIYIRYGTFELFGGTIDASQISTVQYASAVRVNTDCLFNMYGGTIIGGKVVAPENKEDAITNSGYGGTLYVTGTMNMYDGVITGGSCIKSGGNIFVGKAGTLNLYGGTVSDGVAEEKGGNLAGTGKINLYDCTVSGGTAQIYGGNIFAGNGGTVTLHNENTVISSGAAKQGGNIYIEQGSVVSMNAGTIKSGNSTAHGGAVAVYGSFEVHGGQITSGTAKEQGGNIFVGKTGVLNMNGGSVRSGIANTKGGNIAGTGKVNLRGAHISGGSAKSYGGNIFSGKGATVTISNATISGGEATQGGNLYHEQGTTVYMNGGTMKNGKSSAHGGSVAVYGVFALNGGTISGSKANEQGGNIFVGKAGQLTINGGTVQGGTAGTKGGNLAGTGTIKIKGGKIIDGSAQDYGGNLFVSGTVNMSDGSIVGGKAANGGGVAVNGAAYTMTGGVIQGGTATQDGGNVYVARNVDSDGNTLSLGVFSMTGGEISGGTAERYGGNMFTGKECTFTMVDGKVLDGTSAQKGGNINLTGTVVIEGGLISGGESKNGGNINTAGTLEIRGGMIQDGTVSNSTKYDRNIFVEGGSFTLSGGSVVGGVRIKQTDGAVLTGKANIANDQGFENLTLDAGIQVSIGDLVEGAWIGINTTSSEFATDAVETDVAYVASNVEGQVVVYEDGKLYLKPEKDEEEEDGTQPDVTDWTSENSLPTEAGKYRLMVNVTVSSAATTKKNVEIYLDLNGHTITGTNNTRIYVVDAGTTLTITNTDAEHISTIWGNRDSTADAGAIYIKGAGAVFNLEGGVLDASGVSVKSGAAVYVAAGTTFNMSGGTITGGTATGNGGNVYVAAGSDSTAAAIFKLSGGTIENGNAATGGNVCALGEFHMTGGTITGGTATGNATSGNVYTKPGESGCSFTMTGGTIAGLVRVNSTGSVSLGGNAKITGGETNLTLSDKPATLTTTGFSKGAEIFVNLEYDAYAADEKYFGVIGTEGDEQYIQLDGEGKIDVTDSKLYLKPEENEEEGDGDDTQPDVIDWTSNNSLPIEAGKYRLTQTVTLEATANVAADVQLDLNGMTVNANGNQVYNVNAGGVLTIIDTVETGKIIGASTSENGGTVYVSAGGVLNLYSGTIEGGQATAGTGGNIYIQAGSTGGVFNMYGGAVTGGKAKQGGNIYVAAGSTNATNNAAAVFNLYGGTVSAGEGTSTAGNVAALGVMKMEGGEIKDGICNVTGDHKYAANVYTLPGKNKCTFTMTGGTITGWVRVNNAGSFILGGTAKITNGIENASTNNAASGMYVSTNGATVTVDTTKPLTTGAEIYLSNTGKDPIVKGNVAAEYQSFFKYCADGTLSFDENGIHVAAAE